jgi:uncharacterized membrane protein HdeD (DUF308 family)
MNTFFTRNMGNVERILRTGAGAIVVLVTLLNLAQLATWVVLLLVVVGASLIVEGVLAWCPARAILGLGRARKQRNY